MTVEHQDEAERESRLNEILLAYLEEVQCGKAPDRRELLSRHPEFAAELREFLTLREQIGRLAAPLRASSLSGSGSAAPSGPPASGSSHDVAVENKAEATTLPTELGQIGEFRLLREIGRGGMGVVYEAHQISLNRRVALKVLPFAAAFDPKQLRRFENEAQAAAQLHHTNIVPVFGVGQERGVHYYAMQLIDGQSLAALIAELGRKEATVPARQPASGNGPRSDDSPPAERSLARPVLSSASIVYAAETAAAHRESFSTERAARRTSYFRRIAQLVRTAALALEHAHQAGVVHRDIKPANLLLDVRGNLWVTDFGLALFHNMTGLTVTGELLGTLRYMSPEQVSARRGEIDQRTDIYSLGVTFYELLTLRPAFDGQDRNELLAQIAFDDPPAPRRLDRTIPVELETIVLKAIAKEPAERYATATDMADDLQRFLDDKPILARRPSPVERMRKWMRRHPALVGSVLLLLLFGVVGFGVSTALIARAYDDERQRAREAEERFQLARQAADEMILMAEEELANKPFTENARKRMLGAALAYYQKFIQQRRNDPDARAELEVTRDRVKKIIDNLALLQGDRQTFLLVERDVLDDLKLSAEQRARVKSLQKDIDDCHAALHESPRPTAEENNQRMLSQAREHEAQIAVILTPEQQLRLRQIALQSQGPGAFRDTDIVKHLWLTEEQRARIRAIEEDAFAPGPPRPHGPRPAVDFRKMLTERNQAAMERIQKLLSKEQLDMWQRMIGDPYTGALPLPFGPKGPPPH
jgi:serine/threonine protein kinase